MLRIHIDENCALVDEDIAVEETAGAADFSPVHFDIISWPEFRIDPQFTKPHRRRITDFCCNIGQGGYPQRRPVENQLPAQLSFVKIDRPAAGNPANCAYPVGGAVFQVHLPAQVLVPTNQCCRRKSQETNGVRHSVGLPFLNQGGVKRDIGAPFTHTRIDYPEAVGHCCPHLFHRYRDFELFPDLLEILFLWLERIACNVARR